MIGNLLNVRERFVAAPDMTALDVGDDRIGAGIALRVECVGAQQCVDTRPAHERTCYLPRNPATDVAVAGFEAGVRIKGDNRRRLRAGIELDNRCSRDASRGLRKHGAGGKHDSDASGNCVTSASPTSDDQGAKPTGGEQDARRAKRFMSGFLVLPQCSPTIRKKVLTPL
jgi:hypothetical protein